MQKQITFKMEQVEKVRALIDLLKSETAITNGKGELAKKAVLSEEETKTVKDKILKLVSEF